ncbi:transposase [Streptosporangium sp. NPDC020145]|uniref:transposase n=1 Tax=Streptosporangium sp. NPDC020145 TaxID=3154694 RepID=UPI003417A0C4
MRRRRRFSPEFKEEAAHMMLDGPRTVASAARESGMNPTTLGSRVNMHKTIHPSAGRTGVRCDNAMAESFFTAIKTE